MSRELRLRYDDLNNQLRVAREHTAEAKAQFDEAILRESIIEQELAIARDELDQALDLAANPDCDDDGDDDGDGQRAPLEPSPASPTGTPTVRPSIKATLQEFPKDGSSIAVADLRKKFDLSDGALNTRIQKAKKAGLVERAGWGQYKLTPEGKRLAIGLVAVPSAGGGG